ncbi:MAG: hypothetical protein S4CHLAM102_14350 [Chlamydiia bacterium]|nr:hypothetical protein [Chlamydiia bacterium]
MDKESNWDKAIHTFEEAGGTLSMSEALDRGIHRRDLYRLRDEGDITTHAKGLYRLSDLPEAQHPDLITVSKKVPRGVICMTSALAFHELTTQIPHTVHLAIPDKAHRPKIEYPPIECYWYSSQMLSTGADIYHLDGCDVAIFNIEKSLIDCLKFRNKVGRDLAIEALKSYWQRRNTNLDLLYTYAKRFRVYSILKPIMETITNG